MKTTLIRGAGLLGGLAVVGFLVAYWLLEQQSPQVVGVGVVGSVLLVLYLWLDREELSEVSQSRAVRYGTGAALSVALAFGVTIAANVLAKRYDKRWDLTSEGRYTLSDHSISVAKGLAEPVTVLGFFQTGSPEEDSFRDLVEGYTAHTDKLQLKLVDPVQEPLLAQEYAVTSSFGTVVLVQGEKRQRLENDFKEEPFTNAILRLSSAKEHTICFTTGHGEREVDDDASAEGIGGMVVKMEGQNYKAKPFVPLKEGAVPADCEVVIVAGPQSELAPQEREMLARHVAEGRHLIVLIDPLVANETAADLSRYGLIVGDDLVLENNPNYQLEGGDPSYIVLDKASMDFHPIVNDMKAIALLRTVRSVRKGPDVEGYNVQELARTSPQSWAETDLSFVTAGVMPSPDEGVDLIGGVPMMAVVEVVDPSVVPVGDMSLPGGGLSLAPAPVEPAAPPVDPAAPPVEPVAEPVAEPVVAATPARGRSPGGRVLVVGDSDFAGNGLLAQGQNQDLLLNAVAWMVDEEDQIAARTTEGASGLLTMTGLQGIVVWLISVLGAPGLAVAFALRSWLKRRSL